jgi:hypothetical protein
MPLRLSRTVGRVIVLFLLQLGLGSGVAADESPQPVTHQCTFQGVVVPCTVHAVDAQGVQRVEIGRIDPQDWRFDEKDLPVEATALHVELLNHTTYDNAIRYATAELYRFYRAQKAQQLVSLVMARLVQYVKTKYGPDLSSDDVIEAIVLEAGLPVIQVPEAARDIQTSDIMQMLRQSVGARPEGGK